jgi:hypothetical protein
MHFFFDWAVRIAAAHGELPKRSSALVSFAGHGDVKKQRARPADHELGEREWFR